MKDEIKINISVTGYKESDSFPGFVNFEFLDFSGNNCQFEEKAPVITTLSISKTDNYPIQLTLPCIIIEKFKSENAVIIDTSKPYGVESTDGKTQFKVSNEIIA